MLDILDRFLVRKAYSYSRLDGSTPMGMRQTLVDEFNNSPSKQVKSHRFCAAYGMSLYILV
jgi:SNF2 family DNA or RNA helicase